MKVSNKQPKGKEPAKPEKATGPHTPVSNVVVESRAAPRKRRVEPRIPEGAKFSKPAVMAGIETRVAGGGACDAPAS